MIRVNNLSKRYRIFPNALARIKERLTPASVTFHREFWALREVSFEVDRGECLGVVGPNGSGKSTLLRILGRISAPTTGSVEIDGRLGTLLDLGLGFHPDLSGRENVKLNARFLGIDDAERDAHLDEMVAFAELGPFIDLPIRTYSTGMFVRLGFAAAACLNPDVLLIDEVLSVGDAYFQRKCLNRIEHLKGQGKTVLIVSHVLPILQRFCDRALWLHEGRARLCGETREVLREYERFSRQSDSMRLGSADTGAVPETQASGQPDAGIHANRRGTGEIVISDVEMLGADHEPRRHFTTGEQVSVRFTAHATIPVETPVFGLLLHAADGSLLFATETHHVDPCDVGPIEGRRRVEYSVGDLNLNRGTYYLSVATFREPQHPFWSNPADYHNQLYEFKVWSDKITHGHLNMRGHWRIEDA